MESKNTYTVAQLIIPGYNNKRRVKHLRWKRYYNSGLLCCETKTMMVFEWLCTITSSWRVIRNVLFWRQSSRRQSSQVSNKTNRNYKRQWKDLSDLLFSISARAISLWAIKNRLLTTTRHVQPYLEICSHSSHKLYLVKELMKFPLMIRKFHTAFTVRISLVFLCK